MVAVQQKHFGWLRTGVPEVSSVSEAGTHLEERAGELLKEATPEKEEEEEEEEEEEVWIHDNSIPAE